MNDADHEFRAPYLAAAVEYINHGGVGCFVEYPDTLYTWARAGDAAAWDKLLELMAIHVEADASANPALRNFAREVWTGALPRPVCRGQPRKRARDRRIRQIIDELRAEPLSLTLDEACEELARAVGSPGEAVIRRIASNRG